MMTRGRQALFWIGAFVAFCAVVYVLRGMLLPFIAGLLVAYFLDPVVDWVERLRLSRAAATSLVLVVFFSVAVLAIMVLAPYVQSNVSSFIERLPQYVQSARENWLPRLNLLWDRLPPEIAERLRAAVAENGGSADIAKAAVNLVKGVLTSITSLAGLLSVLFITPVVSFYLLRDYDRLVEKIDSWLPQRHAGTVRQLAGRMDANVAGLVRGQTLVCLMEGVFYAVTLSVVGLDLAVPVGLGTGILAFIPYVGFLSGLTVSTILAILQFESFWPVLAVLGVFGVGQAIETVLQPMLVGNRVGLHPVWVIFSLLAGGALFGLVGVLLSIPVAACIGVLVRFALERYLDSPLYRDAASGGGQTQAATDGEEAR